MLETDGIIVMTVTGNFDIDVIIFWCYEKNVLYLYRFLMMVIYLIFHAGLLI